MMPVGIVVRPVHDRKPASVVVDEFSADFDAVADVNRATRRYRNVVDDFQWSGGTSYVEGLVHTMRTRAQEVSRR